MANVSSNNLTTLYSGGGVNVRPTSAYGNANVVALLNVGTDGGNTVTNIVATGNLTIGNITANSNITSGGDITANANITADYYFGNGAFLTGLTSIVVANANYANFAGEAFDVNVSNVTGIGNIAVINLDGNVSNVLRGDGTFASEFGNLTANYANFAGNVTIASQPNITSVGTLVNLSVTGNVTSVSGVFNGNGAGLTNINGANVNTVANANFASFAGNVTNSAQPNITSVGTLVNLSATGNITSVSGVFVGNGAGLTNINGSNVSNVANANFASFAGNVTNSAQPNITSVGTLTSLAVTGNITSGNANLGNLAIANFFSGDGSLLSNINGANVSNVANANYANFAGTLINGTSNVRIPVANGNITFSANGVANIGVLDTTGNLTITNTIIAESANLTGTYNIESSGYYYSTSINLSNAGALSLPSFYFSGDLTTGSNLVTNVVLTDGFNSGYTFNLADYVTELTNAGVNWAQGSPPYNDSYYPVTTIISSVDAPNNQIYLSNNASLSGSGIFNFTGTWLSNASTNSYYLAQSPFITNAIATDATTNNISVTDFNTFNDGYINPGDSIQFIGTSFGNITSGVDYFVNNIDYGNSTFSISTSNGGPDLGLTTATGNLIVVLNPLIAQNIQPLSAGYYYAGPWFTTPVLTDFTQSPAGTINSGTVLNFSGFIKPVDFNSNISPPVEYAGQFTRVDNGMVVADGSYGTPTLTGKLNDVFPVNGVVLVHTGLDANISGSRTNYQLVDYTDNSSGAASITNPLNPPSLAFTSFNGNIDTDVNDSYARNGRAFGRIAWYGAQQVNGTFYQSPGSSPSAGIYVQALGDWNDATNANLPMTMSFQYSPLNAATGGGSSYQRINRTFLQASNNSTYIGGATNIQFKPLARSSNGTNNRSPSALGNSSINPQTFVDISGYTQGNAVSNGAGAVLNITTTSSSWNGDVALRLSRTVGNTANMEFVLPTATTNTLLLKDNASGNTIATFTDGNIDLGNLAVANYFTGTLTTNAQPNITSVGTLISLDITGNLTSGNANLGNLAIANYFSGNLTGNTAIANLTLTKFQETVISGGSVSGTLTPDSSVGTIYNYTLTGGITINSLGNAVAGTSMTLVLTQDGTGGRTLTSSMKFAGGIDTLSTNPNAIDVMSVFYDGSTYYATLSRGFV